MPLSREQAFLKKPIVFILAGIGLAAIGLLSTDKWRGFTGIMLNLTHDSVWGDTLSLKSVLIVAVGPVLYGRYLRHKNSK